jgi:hypothetical protein
MRIELVSVARRGQGLVDAVAINRDAWWMNRSAAGGDE